MCRLFIGFVWHNAGQNQFYFPLIGRFPADCPVSFSAFAGGLRSRALRVRAGFFLFAAGGRGVISTGGDQPGRLDCSYRAWAFGKCCSVFDTALDIYLL
jgi:hypothetical protein